MQAQAAVAEVEQHRHQLGHHSPAPPGATQIVGDFAAAAPDLVDGVEAAGADEGAGAVPNGPANALALRADAASPGDDALSLVEIGERVDIKERYHLRVREVNQDVGSIAPAKGLEGEAGGDDLKVAFKVDVHGQAASRRRATRRARVSPSATPSKRLWTQWRWKARTTVAVAASYLPDGAQS